MQCTGIRFDCNWEWDPHSLYIYTYCNHSQYLATNLNQYYPLIKVPRQLPHDHMKLDNPDLGEGGELNKESTKLGNKKDGLKG